jgi:predicted lipoprotein with Yx(FWY)xxD motif
MKHVKILRQNPFPVAIATSLLGALLGSACLDQSSGITDAAGAVGNPGGDGAGAAAAQGGTKASAGTGNAASGGEPNEVANGGNAPTAGTSGGTGGSTPSGGAGDEPDPQGGAGGAGEEPDQGVHIGHACMFHTEAPAGEGGAGGAPPSDVVMQPSAFVGNYLADSAGRTLYTYGADLPGDCQTPPKSTCVADCLVSWPIFDAGDRVLGTGLDDAAFGSIQREDGLWQTTYRGWPLYYYKTDLTLGQMAGQGKGKIWHVAEVMLPTVTIMKAGTLKYLADIDGHTLYVSAADQAGTAVDDPLSNCSGSCLHTFEPFHEKNFSVVTILEPLDFTVFARHGAGGLQLSYKGMPLYRAATDVKSGDMTGTAIEGFTAAIP